MALVDIDKRLAKHDEELAETHANIEMAEERLKFVIQKMEEEERKNRGIRGVFRRLSGKG
jgi:ABC-type Fe3+-citrate transport system substrate-binding protein